MLSVKPLFKRFQRFEKPLYDMKDRSLKANWYNKLFCLLFCLFNRKVRKVKRKVSQRYVSDFAFFANFAFCFLNVNSHAMLLTTI
ncbi:MAG: hypothetical protein BWK80_37285 [Desulfobacteraceae bacterium IS3]|nr:MAG: hypothetical protein BWK80_37285 [Desulfobacteraceae bacterium IS3]